MKYYLTLKEFVSYYQLGWVQYVVDKEFGLCVEATVTTDNLKHCSFLYFEVESQSLVYAKGDIREPWRFEIAVRKILEEYMLDSVH